ncbi:MAG: 2-oxoacid:ferredoxin oxidoreductase subunit beta, partial [Nitrosopumilaceae archaeon]
AGTDITDESAKETHSRIYKLEDTGYDPIVHYEEEAEINQKLSQALIKSLEWGTKIPTGIFYKNEIITPYAERLMDKIPNYLENPPAKQKISSNSKPTTDVSKILDSLQV